MDPYRSSDKPVCGRGWKGLGMRLVTVCWCLALGCGGALFGVVVGASVTLPDVAKWLLATLALFGCVVGAIGYLVATKEMDG